MLQCTPQSLQIISVWSKQLSFLGTCENNKSEALGEVEIAERVNSENSGQILYGKNMPNKMWEFQHPPAPCFMSSLDLFPKINALSVCLCLKDNSV